MCHQQTPGASGQNVSSRHCGGCGSVIQAGASPWACRPVSTPCVSVSSSPPPTGPASLWNEGASTQLHLTSVTCLETSHSPTLRSCGWEASALISKGCRSACYAPDTPSPATGSPVPLRPDPGSSLPGTSSRALKPPSFSDIAGQIKNIHCRCISL